MSTKLSLFSPQIGAHIFNVGSVSFTLSSKFATGGLWYISGFVPPAPFNGIFTAAISNPPVPVASDLKNGTTGTAYLTTITVQGGTGPYVLTLASGSLPTGLTLHSATGVIDGTPAAVGTFTFTVSVRDVYSAIGSSTFDITIAAAGGAGGSGNFAFLG